MLKCILSLAHSCIYSTDISKLETDNISISDPSIELQIVSNTKLKLTFPKNYSNYFNISKNNVD